MSNNENTFSGKNLKLDEGLVSKMAELMKAAPSNPYAQRVIDSGIAFADCLAELYFDDLSAEDKPIIVEALEMVSAQLKKFL